MVRQVDDVKAVVSAASAQVEPDTAQTVISDSSSLKTDVHESVSVILAHVSATQALFIQLHLSEQRS